jgi:Tfp pilus assembly protein PilF
MYVNDQHEKGMECLKNNDAPTALTFLNNALTENGLHPDLLSDRAVVYLHLKQKQNALDDFDSAINLQPNYGYRYSSRAYARDIFGDVNGAIEDYQHAIDLDAEDSISYNNLGLLEEKLGRMAQAKRQFDKADALRKLQESESSGAVPEERILPDDFLKPNFIKKDAVQSVVEQKNSMFDIVKETLFKASGRKEFWVFVRNGFKSKE